VQWLVYVAMHSVRQHVAALEEFVWESSRSDTPPPPTELTPRHLVGDCRPPDVSPCHDAAPPLSTESYCLICVRNILLVSYCHGCLEAREFVRPGGQFQVGNQAQQCYRLKLDHCSPQTRARGKRNHIVRFNIQSNLIDFIKNMELRKVICFSMCMHLVICIFY
jgi:hypothetical protein